MPCPASELGSIAPFIAIFTQLRFSYRRPPAGAFDFCICRREFKTKFKNAGRRPAVQRPDAPSQRCTHSVIEILATSGTACRAPTAEKATAKRTMPWREPSIWNPRRVAAWGTGAIFTLPPIGGRLCYWKASIVYHRNFLLQRGDFGGGPVHQAVA